MGGVAVELVHLGSLYHDDVMDEATTRRGATAANQRWGNVVAILTGDFLLAQSSIIAADLGVDVARLLGETIAELADGRPHRCLPARPASAASPADCHSPRSTR